MHVTRDQGRLPSRSNRGTAGHTFWEGGASGQGLLKLGTPGQLTLGAGGRPGLQICKSPNLQISKSPNLQISKSPGLQISWPPNLLASKSPGFRVYRLVPQTLPYIKTARKAHGSSCKLNELQPTERRNEEQTLWDVRPGPLQEVQQGGAV